jgi:hypothetical protein
VRTGKWPQRASPGGVGRRGARERKSAKGRGGGEESEGLVFGVFGGRASERVVCVPFCLDAAVFGFVGLCRGGCVGRVQGLRL